MTEIIELHQRIGTKWTEFAKELPGRTENSIKNRWNSTLRRYVCHYKRIIPLSIHIHPCIYAITFTYALG